MMPTTILVYIIFNEGERGGIPDLVILEIFERDFIQPRQFLRQILV